LGRKRKYSKKKEGFFSKLDWSINPETTREISAVICIGIGLLLLLSIFNGAGRVGSALSFSLDWLLGLIGYFVPIVLIALGVYLWKPEKYELKATSVIGIILCFVFIPALFGQAGGVIGLGIQNLLKNLVGQIAAYILIVSFSFASLLLALNTSFHSLKEKMAPAPNDKNVQVHGDLTEKISVWGWLKGKLGLVQTANVNTEVPVKPLNLDSGKVLASSKIEGKWEYPPIDLLELSNTKASAGNVAKNVETIQKTLKDFSIDVAMGDVNIGPTVTQYTFKPKEGIKLNQITARGNDLSLALAAHPIRVEAPIPGKAAVGIEVPNKTSAIVTLREILESKEYKAKKNHLSLALGRDVAGIPFVVDLQKMPHLLIAGSTGSGKSICINGIICDLLYQNSPDELRFLMVDPKRVEFTRYNDIPHLLTPVITDVGETVNMLRWAVSEMDRRFKLFARAHKRDIGSYNAEPAEEGRIPYIVIIIDELADLMAQSAREVEAAIVRLAQMARAVGIHLVVATQRPSVNVITGLIKANITSRVAFAVASQADSRTILDLSGADKLLGNGDMLYLGSDVGKPKRVQGVYVQDKEVGALTNFLRSKGTAQYDESIIHYGDQKTGMGQGGNGGEGDDDMYGEAKETVIRAGKASASLLQRRLRVGYARAARLLDLLESNGVIGPAEGAKPRNVLVGPETLTMERNLAQPPRQSTPMNQGISLVHGDTSRVSQGPTNNYQEVELETPVSLPEKPKEKKDNDEEFEEL